MKLIRTGYILKVNSTRFANEQYGEFEKEESKMTPRLLFD